MTLPFFKNRKSRRELEREIEFLANNRDVKMALMESELAELRKENELSRAIAHSLDCGKKALEKRVLELSELPPPQIKIELRQSTSISIGEWRKEENLISAAATILKQGDMRAMLDVLEYEHPGHGRVAWESTVEQRAAAQCMAEGYQRCLNNLRALGEKPTKKTTLEETWGAENVGGKK